MAIFSADLIRTIARHHGVVTVADLRSDGISAPIVGAAVDRGLLVRVAPGIFLVAGVDESFEQRSAVLCRRRPDAVICGASAAALWDFDLVYRPTRPDYVTDARRPPAPCHVIDRQQRPRPTERFFDDEVIVRPDEIVLTSRARTWLDCVVEPSLERSIAITRHVLDSQCDLWELWEQVDRFESTRRSRIGRAHTVLDSRRRWKRPRRARPGVAPDRAAA